MDFLQAVFIGPLWYDIVLIAATVMVWMAYDIRALTAPSAWASLSLFFVWLCASNSWRFIPQPQDASFASPEDLAEAWRMWTVYLYETLILAYLLAGAITAGVLTWIIWGAYTKTLRITMLTVFYGGVTFIAQAGEVAQRYVCKTNDSALGYEYLYRAHGGTREACGRLFVKIFEAIGVPWAEPVGGTIGPLVFPALTVPLFFIIIWRAQKRI